MQGGGLREGLLALQQQADPQRHLVRSAVLAPVVALVRGVAARPEAACLAATLLRCLAMAGPCERAGIWCAPILRPLCLNSAKLVNCFVHARFGIRLSALLV